LACGAPHACRDARDEVRELRGLIRQELRMKKFNVITAARVVSSLRGTAVALARGDSDAYRRHPQEFVRDSRNAIEVTPDQ
jgi:hypothetical protein